MKKLLIILMVVAMASFLFVGCLGTTPPIDPDEPVEPVEPVEPPTVAPIITSVPDIVGGYINKDAAVDGIVVNGTAPTYSEIKVYINGLTAGTGDTEANGVFQVVVAKADLIKALKTDGAKTLHATAKEPGLAVSASSNVRSFILDTVIPKISSSKAKAGTAATDLEEATATETAGGTALSALPDVLSVDSPDVLDGRWLIHVFGLTTATDNVTITRPDNIVLTYTGCTDGQTFAVGSPIPGVTFDLAALLEIGQYSEIVCVAEVAPVSAVPGYIDVTFDAPVTGASILALTSTWNIQSPLGTAVLNDPSVLSTTVARIFEYTGGDLIAGNVYLISCDGIEDLAGNAIPATAPSSDYGIVLP